MRRQACWLALTAIAPLVVASLADAQPLSYPPTPRQSQVDVHFGVQVADLYRWLEHDVRGDARVKAWVDAQNALTRDYLDRLPQREQIEQRLRRSWSIERYGLPVQRGERYFFTRNAGLQDQPVLYVQDGRKGVPRVLLDPNTWSSDGTAALGKWLPSDDGRVLVYSVQDGGSDWNTLRFVKVSTAEVLDDELKWVKFSRLGWSADGTQLFYSRFPEPRAQGRYTSPNTDMAVFKHTLGTRQAADQKIFATPDRPLLGHTAEVCGEGRWLIVYTGEGSDDRFEVRVWDLRAPGKAPRTLFAGLRYRWNLAGCRDSTLYFHTNHDAPRYRLVSVDAERGDESSLRQIVPQSDAVMVAASRIGSRVIVRYLRDVRSVVEVHRLDGKREHALALPGIGSVDGFETSATDAATLFTYESYDTPPTVYRYDQVRNESSVLYQARGGFDSRTYEVTQEFYSSADGTRIPMFVAHKRDAARDVSRPALLYGYGGFRSIETPYFSTAYLAWMEMGGTLAIAHIRGGGEYGDAWHDAGRLLHKQSVFDDFVAAAEHLIRAGFTTSAQLAIIGDSNGGLLIGAVVNQRPELFAAALPGVGVMDMLRYTQFTAGRYWVDDYGDPAEEVHFRNLVRYSPYHNIRDGKRYPAILVTTGDTDDRVVPGHSFKYAAALQAAKIGAEPHLIRIESRAGHGAGKPTGKAIAEFADMWTFIGYFTGLTRGAGR